MGGLPIFNKESGTYAFKAIEPEIYWTEIVPRTVNRIETSLVPLVKGKLVILSQTVSYNML